MSACVRLSYPLPPFSQSRQAGCQILRFKGAVEEATEEAQALASRGACPPLLKRDPPNSGLRNGAGGQATCSDTRAVRAPLFLVSLRLNMYSSLFVVVVVAASAWHFTLAFCSYEFLNHMVCLRLPPPSLLRNSPLSF
jgi:hypothetical protein